MESKLKNPIRFTDPTGMETLPSTMNILKKIEQGGTKLDAVAGAAPVANSRQPINVYRQDEYGPHLVDAQKRVKIAERSHEQVQGVVEQTKEVLSTMVENAREGGTNAQTNVGNIVGSVKSLASGADAKNVAINTVVNKQITEQINNAWERFFLAKMQGGALGLASIFKIFTMSVVSVAINAASNKALDAMQKKENNN